MNAAGGGVQIVSPGSTARVLQPDIRAGQSVIHIVDGELREA